MARAFRILAALAVLIGFGWSQAHAQVPMTGAGRGAPTPPAAGCSQATTFLARTSLTGSDAVNYTNLICGMVTDGLITGDLSTTGCGSLFDVIYIFATHDAANAKLNICGTNFTATNEGAALTFTPYSGFTGNGGTGFFGSHFNPTTATSSNYVQDSAHISMWNLTTGDGNIDYDGQAGGENFYSSFSGAMFARVNDNVATGGFTVSDPRGHLFGNRSSSTGRQLYQNASTTLIGGTTATYGSSTSVAPGNGDMLFILSSRLMAQASIGSSLNSTQVTNFYNRLRTYMTAVGVP